MSSPQAPAQDLVFLHAKPEYNNPATPKQPENTVSVSLDRRETFQNAPLTKSWNELKIPSRDLAPEWLAEGMSLAQKPRQDKWL